MTKHCNQESNMKIIQLLVYLLIWCQAAETLDHLTALGHNVTINCDLDEGEIYWLLLKAPDPPVMILRTLILPTTFFLFNKTFNHKYSVQSKNHLFINNITSDELGVYYCMKIGIPPKFSNGTRLYVNETSSHSEIEVHYIQQNHTMVKYIEQKQTQWKIISLISGVLNGLLLIAGVWYYCGEKQTPQDAKLKQTEFVPVEELKESKSWTLYTAVNFTSL